MAQAGRRAFSLLSLPAPILVDAAAPAPLNLPRARPFDAHTANVMRWWHDRQLLSARVADAQTAIVNSRTTADVDSAALCAIYDNLSSIYQFTLTVEQTWAAIFAYLSAHGSTLVSFPEFISCWTLLVPLVYEYNCPEPAVPLAVAAYGSGSLVFETVCLAYLRITLLQQLTTFGQLVGAERPANPIDVVRSAKLIVRTIIDNVLPLHFPTRMHNESFLLSSHFYQNYLGPMLVAQHCHLLGMREYNRTKEEGSEAELCRGELRSAALFATAAKALGVVHSSGFCTDELTGALLLHRRALACMLLAQALLRLERNIELEAAEFITYEGERETNDLTWLVVEAFYCARSAVVLCGSACASVYEKACSRASTMYGVVLPPEPPSMTPTIVAALRASAGRSRATEWQRELSSVFISSSIKSSGGVRVVAKHGRPSSNVISIGAKRRTFVIECEYDIK